MNGGAEYGDTKVGIEKMSICEYLEFNIEEVEVFC